MSFSKIENICLTVNKKHTNHEFDEHTIYSMNKQQIWRTCDMFDEIAMNHEHAINQKHAIKFAIEQNFIS